MNQQRKDDPNMHKKILRILTLALAILLLVTVLPQETFADDLEIKEIKNQITSTYKAAKRYSGRPSFSGYCASLVNWQLYLLGITEEKLGNNGNQEYDYFCKQSQTSGGYTVRAYPDERYNLKEALNFVSQDGTKKVYNMIVCFQSTNSAAGRRYGHAFLIHAIIDGIVYYSESSSVSVGGKYFPEGSAIAVSLEDFWQYYCKWDYEGLIYFGRKTYADECSAFTSNLYVSVNETTGLYSSPCTSELDPRSKYRYDVQAGEKVHVIGLYRNTEGECWYELDDGHNGFIPASKTTLISMDYSDIHVSNIVSPLNLRAGNRFSLKGQISSDHNRIYTVRAQIYQVEGDKLIQMDSATAMVDGNDYTLNGSSLSSNLAFRKLKKGTYLYMLAAVVGNYYCENGEVKLQWKTVPLWQARFEVTSSYKGANSVQFDANGGQIEMNQVEHAHGTPVGELPMPQRPGYRFQGWSTDKEGLNMVSANHVIEQNTVLYAQWTVDKNTQGWFPVDGTWYYLSGGQAHEGFFQDSGLVYYAEKGTPITGWKTVDGKHYYFGRNGVMQTGLLEVDGIRYLLGEDGAAMTGWAEVDGYTCYLNPNGSFCSGWQSIDGQLHYFDATSGKLVLTQNQSGNPFDFVVHDKNLASSLLDPILGLLSPVPGN
jgi:uncharacterized repeat protein (TIGR02543 family)